MREFFLGLFVLFISCSNDTHHVADKDILRHSEQKHIPLNTNMGHAIKVRSEDSIEPLINSYGDTVITGVPVPAKRKVMDPAGVEKPVVIPAGIPKRIPANLKLDNIPGAFLSIPMETDSLKKIRAGIDSAFFHRIRKGSDAGSLLKLKQVKGVPVPSRQPVPVKAWPPIMKDNARTNIKYLDVEHGLISTNLIALHEDSEGRIWIASQTKGVSMYDGETFRHYTEKEGLSHDGVTSIMEDKHGNLWFGTLDGICVYDGCSFEHIRLREDLSNIFVNSILEDRYGNVWVGTNEGLFVYRGDSFIHFTEQDGLLNDQIWSVIEDKDGLIWIGSMGGVNIYNGVSFSHLTKEEGLTSNRIWSMLMDRLGRIWIGTDRGLNVFEDGSIFHISESDGLINNVVRTIQEDSYGNLWFGTHGGVSMYDGRSIMHISDNEGLSGNEIRAVLEDSQGNMWFASENGGISIYYGKTFTYYSKKDGFREHGILSFLEDSQGNYWFGDWGSGVSRYDGRNFVHFTQNEGLIQNAVFCIQEDRQGKIWFGTIDGLCNYDGNTFTHFKQEQGLSDNFIRALLEGQDGNLWIGTSKGGVNMYDGRTFTYLTENEGLVDNRVRAILEDQLGFLWFGTQKGVSRYKDGTFTHFSGKEGLGNLSIVCMLEDNYGNIWFGTDGGGVYVFNGSSFTSFTKEKGLCNNNITSLVEDHNGHIWVTSKKGLSRVVFEAERTKGSEAPGLNHIPVIHNYGLMDGLKSMEFIAGGVLSDSRNLVWWGCPKGVVVLDPDHLEEPADPPVTKLTRLDIDGRFMDYHQLEENRETKIMCSGVSRFYNYPLDLELPYKHNHLTFYFAAKDWSASQNLRYAYTMEGLDDQWDTLVTEAMADYRNLPPGRYTFHVKAMGAVKIWSDPSSYSFRILPPAWLKWWAYMIYIFILILLVRGYRNFLIKREKVSADLRIKEAEVEKMQEMDHLKSRFFANISHEFRTPLTLIQGPVEELRQRFQGKQEKDIHLFQTVRRSVKRLHELINQLLDISKLETGHVRLQVSHGNLVAHLKTIILSFLSLAQYKKISYAYSFPEDERMVYFDADIVEKILFNLISNAFKYTPSGGRIQVDVAFLDNPPELTANQVELRVEDTGKGIPGDKLSKIFDRFYQVQDSDAYKAEGTGLGLALVKELVELYRGDIKVESEPGKGSIFSVTLPYKSEEFREAELLTFPSESVEEEDPLALKNEQEESWDMVLLEQVQADHENNKSVILIVEDNDDLRDYLSRILGGSYRILSASNGKTGLKKARENIPDLVISDVMMPEMDGIAMCKRMKSDERTDHIPIIILTAKVGRRSKIEGLETGADDYLIKPFDKEELMVRVENLLEQRRKLRDKFKQDFLEAEADSSQPSDHIFLKRLAELFNKHLADPDFKMSQLSGRLNLSQSQVRRKVLALSGFTPNELFRYYRLKKAAIYFRSGHKNVAQVMYLVGFNNQSYFARCFNKRFGMSPSQFIVAQKNQPVSRHA